MKGSVQDFKILHPKDVLVKAIHKEKFQSDSGIIFSINPSVVDDRPTRGEVLKIGKDMTDFGIGTIVHFEKFAGQDLYFDDEKNDWFVLLDYRNIIGFEYK
jgi:co-chaperonin GroES (HSP10)